MSESLPSGSEFARQFGLEEFDNSFSGCETGFGDDFEQAYGNLRGLLDGTSMEAAAKNDPESAYHAAGMLVINIGHAAKVLGAKNIDQVKGQELLDSCVQISSNFLCKPDPRFPHPPITFDEGDKMYAAGMYTRLWGRAIGEKGDDRRTFMQRLNEQMTGVASRAPDTASEVAAMADLSPKLAACLDEVFLPESNRTALLMAGDGQANSWQKCADNFDCARDLLRLAANSSEEQA
jgi:hypothetical protein